MSDVWFIISDVWCLMFDVWCLMSDVRCLISDVWSQKSDVWCLMSDVISLMCDIWMMFDVWCETLDVRCLMSDVCMSEWWLMFVVRCMICDTVEPRYFKDPREMEKKFEIAGLQNNQGSVKGEGKSKGLRSCFEIVGTSN